MQCASPSGAPLVRSIAVRAGYNVAAETDAGEGEPDISISSLQTKPTRKAQTVIGKVDDDDNWGNEELGKDLLPM